jgi:methionyl aminopeptidase
MSYNLGKNMQVKIHSSNDFEKMRKAGKLAAEVLDYITEYVKAGVTTNELNDLCHNFIITNNATPSPLGYKGYPKSVCTSVNHVVCHGVPSDKQLANGDIINIDVTVNLNGWHGDTSRMFLVGNVAVKPKRLVQVTYDAMMMAIEQVKPGATFGDIGYAIQNYVEKHGFSVVRDYCGHGIGTVMHCEPNVMHYGRKGEGMEILEGMFFTIEPMVNAGSFETRLSAHDGWTVTTKDRSLSAQFEHTIGVTSNGYEIFTLSPKGYTCPPF